MAKLSKVEWKAIREAYEIDIRSTVSLAKEYGVADTTIQRRIKKEAWNRAKTQDVIAKKVSVAKACQELTQDNAGIMQAVDEEVQRRLRLEGVFLDSLELNQMLANKQLQKMGESAELQHINIHSQITNRNKDGVVGKMPTTQVNIQQNNQGMTAPIIAIPAQETEESWQK